MASRNAALALVCLVLLCGAALTEAAECQDVRENWTLKGSEGKIKTIKWPKGETHETWECCDACEVNKGCKKWTLYTTKKGDRCALYKGEANKYTQSYTAVSGEI